MMPRSCWKMAKLWQRNRFKRDCEELSIPLPDIPQLNAATRPILIRLPSIDKMAEPIRRLEKLLGGPMRLRGSMAWCFLIETRCPCRKLNPGVMMMQSAENWRGLNPPDRHNGLRTWSILRQ